MVNRASGPLFVAYIMMITAGVFFLIKPPLILAETTNYGVLIWVWGVFYLVGGLIAATSLLSRRLFKNSIPLWYFETAGIALVITANFVYAFSLVIAGLYYNEYNIIALAFVLAAFSFGLIARSLETLSLIRILQGPHVQKEVNVE